jgi:hypothetical protein
VAEHSSGFQVFIEETAVSDTIQGMMVVESAGHQLHKGDVRRVLRLPPPGYRRFKLDRSLPAP